MGRKLRHLALPCYNSADTVWQGSLTQDQPLVQSNINPASETLHQLNPDGWSPTPSRAKWRAAACRPRPRREASRVSRLSPSETTHDSDHSGDHWSWHRRGIRRRNCRDQRHAHRARLSQANKQHARGAGLDGNQVARTGD